MSDSQVGGKLDWPPTYILKKCSRSKHVKLKTSAKNGLELVVPLRFNQKHIPEILEANKAWIKKQLAKLLDPLKSASEKTLPDSVTFLSLNQKWTIQYIKTHHKKCKLVTRPGLELVIYGDLTHEKCFALLNNWARIEAEKFLSLRLKHISNETNLEYKNLTIRAQQTRWGSCSSLKNINLNYKLIFLPSHLVDHILIHELCHTKVMNHSASFWKLVASHDILWRENNRDVRAAQQFIPNWAE